MKSILIYVLFFFLITFNSISFSKPADIFEGIKLTSDLPQIFEAGESYYLKGTIENFQEKARISANLNYIDYD